MGHGVSLMKEDKLILMGNNVILLFNLNNLYLKALL